MARKKSQLQMMETIIVLFIFFIIVGIGFIFYTKVYKGNIDTIGEGLAQENSIKITQRAIFLPEIQCSSNNIQTDNCLDKIKLDAAETIMGSNRLFYFDKFSYSEIIVEEVYPSNLNSWQLYENTLDEYTHKLVTNTPITIFYPDENRNAFGVIKVSLYLR